MPDLILYGIPLAALISALVQVAKKYGLPAAAAPYLNVLLSAIAAVAVLYLGGKPEYQNVTVFVLQLLAFFLQAAGVYTTAKFVYQERKGLEYDGK